MDFDRFSHLSFDCYGTLIDWESGILAGLAPVLRRHGIEAEEPHLVRLYARHEAELEAGPYVRYRQVLRDVLKGLGDELGFTPTETDRDEFAESVGSWPPFDDSTRALQRLHSQYKLVIISNVDDSMFADSERLLAIEFDKVITAQQVGSYKPSPENFRIALDQLGVPVGEVLHVAQSLYHDHAPAKELGFTTVHVNRASRNPGTGVAPETVAAPDYEVPDLDSLVALLGI